LETTDGKQALELNMLFSCSLVQPNETPETMEKRSHWEPNGNTKYRF